MRWARALLKTAAALPLLGRGGLDRLDLDEFAWRSKRTLEALCRARTQSAYVGENEALCRILGRYKLYLDTRDAGLGAHLLLDGFWEMGLTMHIARTVGAGMNAIDVGANFGYYTILLGALVGETGHVVAVEPAPATAAMLRRSVELNGFQKFTTVVEAAAGTGEFAERLGTNQALCPPELFEPYREFLEYSDMGPLLGIVRAEAMPPKASAASGRGPVRSAARAVRSALGR